MSETPSSPSRVASRPLHGSGLDAVTDAERTEWMRQVNHIRKQEFAYLRSVQKRQAGEVAESMLAGLPVRLPRAGKMRGDTLKKIDEIEAQLDLLWVASRSKRADSIFGVGDTPSANAFSTSVLESPSVITQTMHHSEMPASVLLVQSLDHHTKNTSATGEEFIERSAVTLSPKMPAPGTSGPDEVLTRAAEQFANAEYDLAAQQLTRSLRDRETNAGQALHRLLALLDIYRATGNQAQFDWSVLEYFDFWDGNTPQWQRQASAYPIASAPPTHTSAAPRREIFEQSGSHRSWRCPSVLDRIAADGLQAHWCEDAKCTIDWTSLSTIDSDAAAQLTKLFDTERGAPEQLVCIDTPNLLYVLEQATPIGRSEINRDLWLLRFSMLRVMGMRAAFEAACTDFCLTYIEPSPAWYPSAIQFTGDAVATASVVSVPVSNSPWYLQGHVRGETGLGLAVPASGRVNVDCAALVRMDPAATTLLVDWLQKAAACSAQVHFNDVGLLPGAAWNAAGVGALAHIHLRDAP